MFVPNRRLAADSKPTRDRPPPCADPWCSDRWPDEGDRARFQEVLDLFAYHRSKHPHPLWDNQG